jgi:hypothetical protein
MVSTVNRKQFSPAQVMDYVRYMQWMQELAHNKQTSGTTATESNIHFTHLNERRMLRLNKTIEVLPSLFNNHEGLPLMDWMVITESWCGDAAQNLPAISKVADFLNIPLAIVLRDDNPEIMDAFLTNGSRAIPKLIMFDRITGNVLAEWGPRPAPAQQLVLDAKANQIPSETYNIDLQQWYNSDKSLTLQKELATILTGLI